MAKREVKRERRSVVLEPDAAGIDIGAEEIYVAVVWSKNSSECLKVID